ncbi:MAG TPA: isoprenylcysteine carboxylmethyltransferase family protein [Solirubrobacteraceae bacterium]|nr:isoprenylcysteine carboxylmethyltransferase family protein [Solirubrobacteraceae bacterium]
MELLATARPLVLHPGPARDLWDAVIAAWAIAELGTQLRRRRHAHERIRVAGDPTLLAVFAGIGGGLTLAQAAARAHLAPLPGGAWWPVIAGLAITVAGVALRLWAIVTLGRFFRIVVVIAHDHRLVDRGPYRRIRHPSYTGLLLAVVGLGLALGDWVALGAALLLSLAGLLVRIRAEERALLAALGGDYADYMARTWRLVPGVW